MISANYRKGENSVTMPFLNYYKYMVLGKFCYLLRLVSFDIFCARSYHLSDSWVCFAEILVNLNTFGT